MRRGCTSTCFFLDFVLLVFSMLLQFLLRNKVIHSFIQKGTSVKLVTLILLPETVALSPCGSLTSLHLLSELIGRFFLI